MTLTQGQQLNSRYTIQVLLGQGGFGAVYKAWDNTLNVPCAVKESFLLSPEGQRQFLHEAQILAGLRHPNLPRVTDFFTIPEQGQYLVMDFVEGQDLEELRLQTGGRLPEVQALAWIAQVCDALSYLHRQKPPVIHRDIKPPNIRVAPPDEDYPQGRAMLVDFGIAKAFDPVMRTTMGARAVTPGFSPHEQYGQTAAITDPRTDLYALGATLYTLLTGQVPPESVLRLLRDPLVPPRALNPAISAQTESLILQALQNDPELRFQNATDFKTTVTKSLSVRNSQPPEMEAQPVSPYSLTRLAVRQEDTPLPSLLTPLPPDMPLARPARPVPWKWIGIGAGLLAGLVLFAALGSLLAQQIGSSRLTQTSQARASQTAQAVAGSFSATSLPSPISPSLTLRPSSPAPSLTPIPSALEPVTPMSGSTQISSVDGMMLVYIPGGTFQMGEEADRAVEQCQQLYEPFADDTCLQDWYTNEEPVHTVTLDAFWMDGHEVTNAQYALCVAAGGCSPPGDSSSYYHNRYYGEAAYADYPVIWVNWNQAAAYCEWAGRELPTEAQWEYAARGGLEGAMYSWGDPFDGSLANFCDLNCSEAGANQNFDDGSAEIAPVGSYLANGYGLFDIDGNVQEWVADWYGSYSDEVIENPSGPDSGDGRGVRGGAWLFSGDSLRVSLRTNSQPVRATYYYGFRCACSAMVDTTSPRTPAPTRPPISPSPVRATPTTTPAGPFIYMVQTGDTLALIAVSFNSEVSTLLALNPAIDPQTQALTIGQVILIPSSGTSIRAQTSTVDGMVMSYIPAGTFQMGEDIDRAVEACQLLYEPFATDTCSADWYGAEGPVHTVTLDAFWMDQTEVTNGMYAQCVESGACSPPGRTSSYSHSNYYGDPTYANYPVMFVNWEQAETYCEWAGRELPTEAQWEYAARGGLAGALYPWGDSFDGSLANFCDAKCTLSWPNQNFYDGYMDTAPSGSFLPNGYGLYDMAGNVFEWVADWYGDYSSSAVENPTGPDSGDAGIIRGGSWRSYGNELRVSYRSGFTPTNANRTIGFRCALSP